MYAVVGEAATRQNYTVERLIKRANHAESLTRRHVIGLDGAR